MLHRTTFFFCIFHGHGVRIALHRLMSLFDFCCILLNVCFFLPRIPILKALEHRNAADVKTRSIT